jgi:hypothetical protein
MLKYQFNLFTALWWKQINLILIRLERSATLLEESDPSETMVTANEM